MDVETLNYVKKSSYRVRTVKAIGENVKTPKQIAEDSEILINHISNVLGELKDKGVVVCLNPNLRKGRLYRLSSEGFEILDELE